MADQGNFADRFSAEVDRILEQRGRAEAPGPPPEYTELLALAERLAAVDFGTDRPLHPRLRRRLLHRLERDVAARHRPRWWQRPLLPRSRRALGTLMALVALVALVGWTPPGRAVAQAVGEFIQELRWSHTTVRQISPGEPSTPTPVGQTDAFSFKGRDFFFSEPVRDEVVPLSQAISEAGFALQVPAFVPDGYVLAKVHLFGAPPHVIFMIYEGAGGRLGFYQSPVGVISKEHPGGDVAVVESRWVDVVTDGRLEEVTVGTVPAALIDGESLAWEENDVSFRLIGPGLDPATLIQIAESLSPAR